MKEFRGYAVEVLCFGDHHEAGHLGRAGAYGEVVIALGVETGGLFGAADCDEGAEFAVAGPDEGVEAGLGFLGNQGFAVQEAVEHLGHGLGGFSPEHEDSAREMAVMEKLGVLDRVDESYVLLLLR